MKKGKDTRVRSRKLISGILSIVIVVVSVLVGALLVLMNGADPLSAYSTILSSTFGSPQAALYTLSISAPLVLASLGILIAFKAGFFNAGGEGQMMFGGLMGLVATYTVNINNTPMMLLLGFAAAFIGGGAWACICGVLKVMYKVDEIISTLLLSSVAFYTVFYLIRVPFAAGGSNSAQSTAVLQSVTIRSAAELPQVLGVNSGFFVALGVAIFTYFLFTRTKLGFRIRVLGANKEAAIAYYGKSYSDRLTVLVSFLSGGVIGMAGMVMVSAFTHNIIGGSTGGSYAAGGFTNSFGFIGFAVVFLAMLNPLVAIPAAVFFVTLVIGGLALLIQMNIPSSLTVAITAVAIMFVSARQPIVDALSRRTKRLRQ